MVTNNIEDLEKVLTFLKYLDGVTAENQSCQICGLENNNEE